jgi:hypothetical protein
MPTRDQYEKALRSVIGELDYDLAKSIEMPEDGGPDGFPALAEKFEGLVAEAGGE